MVGGTGGSSQLTTGPGPQIVVIRESWQKCTRRSRSCPPPAVSAASEFRASRRWRGGGRERGTAGSARRRAAEILGARRPRLGHGPLGAHPDPLAGEHALPLAPVRRRVPPPWRPLLRSRAVLLPGAESRPRRAGAWSAGHLRRLRVQRAGGASTREGARGDRRREVHGVLARPLSAPPRSVRTPARVGSRTGGGARRGVPPPYHPRTTGVPGGGTRVGVGPRGAYHPRTTPVPPVSRSRVFSARVHRSPIHRSHSGSDYFAPPSGGRANPRAPASGPPRAGARCPQGATARCPDRPVRRPRSIRRVIHRTSSARLRRPSRRTRTGRARRGSARGTGSWPWCWRT